MRPLRLTKKTWQVVADWAGEQPPARQRLALKFLRSLMDGSWVDDFDNIPTNTEGVTVFLERPKLPAFMTVYEDGGFEYGNVFDIEDDPGDDGPDNGELLGVDPEPQPGLDDEGRRPPADPPELYPEPGESQEEYERRLRRFRRSG